METSAASDSELLAAWVAHRRESAFHALVARYATLVHMTAKRTCGDDSLAADASQLVFILLARKAKSLTTHPTLAGWLHVTAVMKTRDLLDKARRESRKRQHLSAAMETDPFNPPGDAWKEMQPVLDDALAALSEKDREALLLRFYRSLSIREIAATLGIATDAAQKRIDRATERLRGKLARRGVQAGGSLCAAMLAGFAADAQAVVLPVSAIASKAIAAGTVSSFSLSAIITSIAALMKSSSLIPPAVALILAGAWTGTKYHSLSATEARNGLLRDEIAEARSAKTSAPVKTTKDDGPINWQKLASERRDGPETARFLKRLETMTREDMIAALDQITALEVTKDRRSEIESMVVMNLQNIDPEWVLNHFMDLLRTNGGSKTLEDCLALEIWARKDLGKATAWLDARIAAGDLESKQLDEDRGSELRHHFEAQTIAILVTADPAAAARRLGAVPEKQRESVISPVSNRMCNTPLTGEGHLAFANLIRSLLPPDRQSSILLDGRPRNWEDDYPQLKAYMDKIEATIPERISCIEEFSGGNIRGISNKRKVTLTDLEPMRGQFAEISPEAVDAMTGRSLAEAVKGRNSSMLFPQASELAVGFLETSGNDAVLATFLECARFDESDKKRGLELAGEITDESRRAEILKRFE